MINKVSVIGLGKLGSPIIATLGERGFKTLGADINEHYVTCINNAEAPVEEPLLDEMLKKNKDLIKASLDVEDVVYQTDATLIIVPTPSEANGEFSTAFVIEALKPIAKALARKSDFHVIVLTSTVLPGASEKDIIPVLENLSGKKCGVDFGYCYNPEFIALGSVIKNLLNPDFILIGESDKKSGDLLEEFYKRYCENNPPIQRMRIVNAEITKISINTFVTTKISFANMIAQLCDMIPGGNVDEVTSAVGLDKRIGLKYLKGGVGYGGPCFPRDNRALAKVYDKFGLEHSIAKATDKINQSHADFIVDKITKLIPEGKSVAVLGLSYKPNTPVIEESQNIQVAKKLIEKGYSVTAYDPLSNDNAKNILSDINYTQSVNECIKDKDLICLMTTWEEFSNLDPNIFKNNQIVVDCWRILDPEKFQNHMQLIHLGINK
ncbi:MAG: UDP-glucose dehydrogenase family protein [Patescibacteria group bacterium]